MQAVGVLTKGQFISELCTFWCLRFFKKKCKNLMDFCPRTEVIYSKYSKLWPYTVAYIEFYMCYPIQISYLNFEAVLVLPKTAGSAQTHNSISFIWIVWSTVYLCHSPKQLSIPLNKLPYSKFRTTTSSSPTTPTTSSSSWTWSPTCARSARSRPDCSWDKESFLRYCHSCCHCYHCIANLSQINPCLGNHIKFSTTSQLKE